MARTPLHCDFVTRARTFVAAALGLALAQAACIPDDRFPVSVTVLGYEAPAARNGYVFVYDPYPYDKQEGDDPRGDQAVITIVLVKEDAPSTRAGGPLSRRACRAATQRQG